MDNGNQENRKKTKGLRSKRRRRLQFPPFNGFSATATTAPVAFVDVCTTIFDYATSENTFSPLELEIADALRLLGHDSVSSTKPKMYECNVCGGKFPSGQALGGQKRLHYKGVVRKRVAAVAGFDPVEPTDQKKPKSDVLKAASP